MISRQRAHKGCLAPPSTPRVTPALTTKCCYHTCTPWLAEWTLGLNVGQPLPGCERLENLLVPTARQLDENKEKAGPVSQVCFDEHVSQILALSTAEQSALAVITQWHSASSPSWLRLLQTDQASGPCHLCSNVTFQGPGCDKKGQPLNMPESLSPRSCAELTRLCLGRFLTPSEVVLGKGSVCFRSGDRISINKWELRRHLFS